ncbi:cbb3-type cytochrome c oxidase N-terminal domain-containing protein [Haloferula sp. A504]|jgi:cytochrome c oxidase cbb3-type subunit 3|uniref:cbb3-type cytochrome c oxidase N-terminal domain-containing protein n=1 Tax=Haloferula sp. A504 TaxID=3373601 RepID=UPI0031BEFABD|nr:c-type cytochrome [Verrucomicrobiaceae bacterium E54]
MSEENSESEVKRGAFAKKKGEVILREHEYDGIQEFDQKLPNWWLFTFYFAIIWFVVYWVIYYHTDAYKTDSEKIVEKMEAIQERKEGELADALASINDQVLIEKWATDPEIVATGEATYMQVCIACHGTGLDAKMGDIPLSGRPLNDGEWQYGKAPMAIFEMINNGSPEGSGGYNGVPMVAKGGAMLTPEQVAQLTAFLISKNPDDYAGATFDENGKLIE